MNANSSKFEIINIVILILTVYVLVALLIDMSIELDPETSKLLGYIDNGICVIFLIEWFYRFSSQKWKISFLKWGWIDLLASIPMIEPLRFGRVFRLIRIIRIIRAYKSAQSFLSHLFTNKAVGSFTTVSTMTFLLVIFSSIAILQAEKVPEGNIKTAEDAIWWAYTTVTTVGYGDLYPVTTEGRLIAMVLMTAGVGVFGTFTAFAASWFISKEEDDSK